MRVRKQPITLARSHEVSEGSLCGRWVGQHCIALTRYAGQVRAFLGACPHRKAQLAMGKLHEGVLTCPWHGWRFDIATGRGLTNPHSKLEFFPVVEEEDEIRVWIPDHLLPCER